MKKAHRKKGFTLIELLVVITIIGILAGIAFVGFGDVFSTAGRTTAQKNLKTVYEALAAKTRSFPMEGSSSLDEASVEGFIVWWRNKTNDTRPELWFVGEDEKVKDLQGDESGPGVPSNISDEVEMEGEQKEALGYCVALPGEDAETKNFLTSLKSGAFPLIWSRGLTPVTTNGQPTALGEAKEDTFSLATEPSSGLMTPREATTKESS